MKSTQEILDEIDRVLNKKNNDPEYDWALEQLKEFILSEPEKCDNANE